MKLLNKKSFTLLEIVVVLFIVGLLYALSITTFSKNLNQEETYDLKKLLQEKTNYKNGLIELLVFDEYALLTFNGKIIEDNFGLPKDTMFYSYLQNDNLKEKFGYFLQSDYMSEIKFKYTIYPNGSSTKMILKIGDVYQTYFPYFDDIQSFDDLYKAQEYLLSSDLKNNLVVVDD